VNNCYGKGIGEPATVIDLGANVGIFDLWVLSKNKDCKIFAYEPDKDSFQRIVNHIKDNGLEKNIFPFQNGVG